MKVVLGANDTVISKAELERLRRIEVAHDAYLAASRIMGGRQADRLRVVSRGAGTEVDAGWLQCLHDFNEAVVSAPQRAADQVYGHSRVEETLDDTRDWPI